MCKLAVTLGRAPSEIRRLPYSDLIELMAYDYLEPFGAVRDNWHMAVQAQMFAAAHTKKGRTPPKIQEFMYQHPEDKRETNARGFMTWLNAKANNGNRRK